MSTVCLSHPDHFGLLIAREWALSPMQTLLLPLKRGDLLQSLQGTIWITVDGQRQDLFLSGSETHTVAEDARLHISGFDKPRLKVLSQCPLQVLQQREISGWRTWPRKARFWTLLHTDFPVRIAA
ncbi:MAG: hypothetical protein CVU22_18205 [Betaproteobacteria bacterium HGW-Betaproteobacteria-16]|nr:MAG: hypothetical protein CVU22_18205 [Betaproteobacteria bacterium HGW-Betaproteobacteria-16]